MLVLTRKLGQQVVIGDGIEVTVLAVRRGRIKLGITCPDDVTIRRKEVLQRSQPTARCELPTTALGQPQLVGGQPAFR